MVHVFIDELGSFAGLSQPEPAVSVVGALAIPDGGFARIVRNYLKLRAHLPKRNGEVKGSLLSANQAAAVIEMLRQNGAIFSCSMVDLSYHTENDIFSHRDRGLLALAANLRDGHSEALRASVANLQRRMAKFKVPNYVQMMVTLDLLHHLLTDLIIYHCQRDARELGAFHWVVDSKSEGPFINDWEEWWSSTLVVWLQAISIKEPGQLIPGGDYRFMQRFFMPIPDYLRDAVGAAEVADPDALDLKLLFQESFRFSPAPEPGLELVDIVTNTARRALVGNLERTGWLPLRSLMLHRGTTYIRPVGFHNGDRKVAAPYGATLREFREGGRVVPTKKPGLFLDDR